MIQSAKTRGCALTLAAMLLLASSAMASPFDRTGVIRVLRRPHARLAATQSTNWFGYGQGAIEQGVKLFYSVTADWVVPRVRPHQRGHAGQSATWIGIGGGCADAGCVLSDPATLIQTGTEQDVDSSGHASYSAWWELVPIPAITISSMTIRAGDRIHASVAEIARNAGIWKITLQDRTRHETFSTTLPYAASHASAEWIEETPVTIGAGSAGFASLPNLTETRFDNATVNGHAAAFKRSEEIQLYNGSRRIGTPSAPDGGHDGFGACAWSLTCRVPAS